MLELHINSLLDSGAATEEQLGWIGSGKPNPNSNYNSVTLNMERNK